MTASLAYDPERMTGFRLDQLAASFDRVRHPRDWKAPVRAVIASTERDLVEAAIVWFTGSVPEFTATPTGELEVQAPGYRTSDPPQAAWEPSDSHLPGHALRQQSARARRQPASR